MCLILHFLRTLTIMEEGHEFVQRFTGGELKERPMFTSCCPGWIRFHQDTVSTFGEISFFGKITAADVRGGDEDLFCREDRRSSRRIFILYP